MLKKNQAGATHGRHISGKATTVVWYFGTCKTQGSYRTIEIGDSLVNALKEYKEEQEKDKIEKVNRDYFENHNYKVYFTGARYEYKGGFQNVQPNELMIAIKEE